MVLNLPIHAHHRPNHPGSADPRLQAFPGSRRLPRARRRLLQEARHRQPASPRAPQPPRKSLRHRAPRLRSPRRKRLPHPRRPYPIPPVMLDLSKYQSIGAALKDALDQFANEVCLIESDREREKERLTYREFKERAHPLARASQDTGFKLNDRAAIIMTNQSKWLISAYAIFYIGGVLVPLDYKLTPEEQWQLLAHSNASVLITEYPIWRQLATSPSRSLTANLKTILVTEAPP